MTTFAETFPEQKIVATLSHQLGWSHFVEIIPLKDPLQRDFYAEMCRLERWSVRRLREKIGSMLFERTDCDVVQKPAAPNPAIAGPWSDVYSSASPYETNESSTMSFYRIRGE